MEDCKCRPKIFKENRYEALSNLYPVIFFATVMYSVFRRLLHCQGQ
jgi:hypothetical protein